MRVSCVDKSGLTQHLFLNYLYYIIYMYCTALQILEILKLLLSHYYLEVSTL